MFLSLNDRIISNFLFQTIALKNVLFSSNSFVSQIDFYAIHCYALTWNFVDCLAVIQVTFDPTESLLCEYAQ